TGVDPVPQAPDNEITNGKASEAWIHSALRTGWKLRLAEYMCFRFGDRWGTKGTSPEWASKEAIARLRADGSIDVWDVLVGAASGRPVLSAYHPEHFHVPGYFIAVTPVDHVSQAPTSPIVRPALPFVKGL